MLQIASSEQAFRGKTCIPTDLKVNQSLPAFITGHFSAKST